MSTRGTSRAAEKVSFERPPRWAELDDLKKQFDALPASARHFIRRLIQSNGNFYQAAKDSGYVDENTQTLQLSIPEETNVTKALRANGITQNMIFARLKECVEGVERKLDGKGNVVEVDNMMASLKGIKMVTDLLRGEEIDDKGKSLIGAEELFKNTDV